MWNVVYCPILLPLHVRMQMKYTGSQQRPEHTRATNGGVSQGRCWYQRCVQQSVVGKWWKLPDCSPDNPIDSLRQVCPTLFFPVEFHKQPGRDHPCNMCPIFQQRLKLGNRTEARRWRRDRPDGGRAWWWTGLIVVPALPPTKQFSREGKFCQSSKQCSLAFQAEAGQSSDCIFLGSAHFPVVFTAGT